MIALPIARAASSLRRPWLAALPIALSLAWGVHARHAGDEVCSGEDTFRYADVVMARQAFYRELARRADPLVILTEWPMDQELTEPWLGWVSQPRRAISLAGLARRPAGFVLDAVVLVRGGCNHERLLAEAQRRGMTRAVQGEVHGVIHELWTR